MGFMKTLLRASVLWAQDNALEIITCAVLPAADGAVTRVMGRVPARWLTHNLAAAEVVIEEIVPSQANARWLTLAQFDTDSGEE